MNKIFSFIASIAGYFVFIYLFGIALINPIEYIDFIYHGAIAIFIVEFLSIHSGFLFSPFVANKNKYAIKVFIAMFIFYSLFALIFGLTMQSFYPPLFFCITLLSKFFWSKSSPTGVSMAAISIVIFLLVMIPVAGPENFWERLFPFPIAFDQYRPESAGGLFTDMPQTVLVWGVLYYSILVIIEILLFKFGKKDVN